MCTENMTIKELYYNNISIKIDLFKKIFLFYFISQNFMKKITC